MGTCEWMNLSLKWSQKVHFKFYLKIPVIIFTIKSLILNNLAGMCHHVLKILERFELFYNWFTSLLYLKMWIYFRIKAYFVISYLISDFCVVLPLMNTKFGSNKWKEAKVKFWSKQNILYTCACTEAYIEHCHMIYMYLWMFLFYMRCTHNFITETYNWKEI